MFYNQIDVSNIEIHTSQTDKDGLYNYLIDTIQMNPKRVQTTMKKFHNVYK